VKRKSTTSAWRRSTSSTRRTRERFGAWYTKPVAAAAAAEAAVAAAEAAAAAAAADAALALAAEAALPLAVALALAAEAAELAGELVGELPAQAAARRGELAAGARADRFPIVLKNTGPYGRVRQKRPGQSISCLQRCPRVANPCLTAEWVSSRAPQGRSVSFPEPGRILK